MYKNELCSTPSAEGKHYMIQNLHRDIVPRKESVFCIRAIGFYSCGTERKYKGWEGSCYALMLMAVAITTKLTRVSWMCLTPHV
jgi:hypothetical protein